MAFRGIEAFMSASPNENRAMTDPIAQAANQAGISYDDAMFIQTLPVSLLLAIAKGRIDVKALAAHQLANCGLGRKGEWVGFPKAEKIWMPKKTSEAEHKDCFA